MNTMLEIGEFDIEIECLFPARDYSPIAAVSIVILLLLAQSWHHHSLSFCWQILKRRSTGRAKRPTHAASFCT